MSFKVVPYNLITKAKIFEGNITLKILLLKKRKERLKEGRKDGKQGKERKKGRKAVTSEHSLVVSNITGA